VNHCFEILRRVPAPQNDRKEESLNLGFNNFIKGNIFLNQFKYIFYGNASSGNTRLSKMNLGIDDYSLSIIFLFGDHFLLNKFSFPFCKKLYTKINIFTKVIV